MTKTRRTYQPRIVGDKVMMPADLKRLHKYMLEIEHIDHISDEMRAVVEAPPEAGLFFGRATSPPVPPPKVAGTAVKVGSTVIRASAVVVRGSGIVGGSTPVVGAAVPRCPEEIFRDRS
jgi:hypothetical protein